VHWVASLFLSCLEVGWSIEEDIAEMVGQTGTLIDIERSRFGLWFSCLAWKPCDGCHLPRLAQGHGGGGWLHCSCGWCAVGLGRLPGGFLWGM